MKERILLVDGNSILNRGFYGLPLLTNKEGVFTNGLLGFLNILVKTLEECKPSYLIVAFDVKHPTFRHEIFKEYKGTRKPMPDELRMQLPLIREVLSSMQIPIVELPGYEADDILGTLAKRYEKEGLLVTLLSGDRDLLQIASDDITISIPKTIGGKTETKNYNTEDVVNEYGVTPLEFIDVKALQGDTSDNIPGVRKVGPKTATDLIQKYKCLEGVYEHIEEVNGKALKQNLLNDKEQAYLSRTLATIEINAPVDTTLSDCVTKDFLNNESLEVLRKYELKSIITKLEAMEGATMEGISDNRKDELKFEIISDYSEAEEVFKKAKKLNRIGLSAICDDGIAISLSEDENYFIEKFAFITDEFLEEKISELVSEKINVSTYDIKKCYEYLGEYQDTFDDVQIMAYILEPIKGEYSIGYIGEHYLSRYVEDEKTLKNDNVKYSCLMARNSLLAHTVLAERLNEEEQFKLYREIEMPLSYVLYDMEKEGILINRDELIEYSSKLSDGILLLEEKIYEKAGEKFNINSPKQLGEILFEKLQLPGGKKTKTGYSTAADVLEKLSVEYPIVSDILEYRMLAKLKSTYAEGLQNCIAEDGRIHTHFNQTITATGRISSTEPNLQNIPIRTELGRELRKAFYPKPGCVFVDADYSQIELRLMAHISGDEKLIEAYKSNKDIHRATAALVFNKSFDEVTDQDRRNAKAVNFGIIYGISSYGLSQGLSISTKEAKKYIEDYFETYPDVKRYVTEVVSEAKEKGYTLTLFGRRRPIPELRDSNFMRRSFGERVAMNAPLQGTAADIMKIAMIRIFKRLKEANLKSKLLIQVHDEVLLEAYEDELEQVLLIVSEEMKNAAQLKVSLEVDCKSGMNWYEAH